jgi:acyl carrier protein phosphodiesterase
MNFLAHLHLASLAESSLTGNLLADFMHGIDLTTLPESIQSGIQLHRRIDVYTDSLPAVQTAKTLFRAETRRVAPIALDVIWDHFLSRHWSAYCFEQSLTDFCRIAEQQIAPTLPNLPKSFRELNHKMWVEKWLQQYASKAMIGKVLAQMAQRRPKLISLAACHVDFMQNYTRLEHLFRDFYPAMMQCAQNNSFPDPV